MTTLETALLLHKSGLPLSIVPANEKGPTDANWPKRRYTEEEIRRRYGNCPSLNVGLVLGPLSGIDIECDSPEAEAELQEIFGGDIPPTPTWQARRGLHRWFQWDEAFAGLGAVIKYKHIEIRLGASGKGAQSLLPPSVTDDFVRKWVIPLSPDTPPAELPASIVNLFITAKQPKEKSGSKLDPKKPGDDFCVRATWDEILIPHGWTPDGTDGKKINWKRPGKTAAGLSATTGFCESEAGRDLMYVFSTEAAPFEANRSYNKFAAYALLNHDGDFNEAAAALADLGYGEPKRRPSASATLIKLAEDAELFHSSEGDSYATFKIKGRYETYGIESKGFKRYLEHRFYEATGRAPSSKAMTEAVGVIAAKARYDGPELQVHLRLAQVDDTIYLDLCNKQREVIEITAAGWDVIDCPSHIKFRRAKGQLALPYPEHGASIDSLRPFVNVDDKSWYLLVAGLVAALRPIGPYVIVLFLSNHGSCKSTTMRVCRQIIDPNVADIRAAPHDVQTLMLAATNGLFICIDNSDGLQPWLSSALCRVSTGGGLGTRALFTNDEEHLFNCMRPVWITGITDLTNREDFLSRCVIVNCPSMSQDDRRDEASFYRDFEQARPRILGALLTAASAALRNLPNIREPRLPRMADFYRWCVAAEKGLGWEPGTFKEVYASSQEDLTSIVLDNPLAHAICQLLTPGTQEQPNTFVTIADSAVIWTGTSQPLLDLLTNHFSTPTMRASDAWPKTANSLSNRLNRLKVNLADIGITVCQHRRTWAISRAEQQQKAA